LNRRDRGADAEELACQHLRRAGYAVVERNARSRLGEIDIVVEQAGTIVFVEVRSRSSRRFGTPFESVDARKQRRLGRLASAYLQRRHLLDRRARFDVIAVEWQDGTPMIDHLENAFDLVGG
jgi:putative endonuclease